MKHILISIAFAFILHSAVSQDIMVKDLTCDHKVNPVGIDNPKPRFSWKLTGKGNNIMQAEYSLRVSSDPKFSKIVWQTGSVKSDESILRPYSGPALQSGQRYYWQVRITDNKGRTSKWSDAAFFEMGLLSESEWKAK